MSPAECNMASHSHRRDHLLKLSSSLVKVTLKTWSQYRSWESTRIFIQNNLQQAIFYVNSWSRNIRIPFLTLHYILSLNLHGPGSDRQVCEVLANTHRDTQNGSSLYCPRLIRVDWHCVTIPKNKRLAADVRELYQCSISPPAPGQPHRRGERPNRWRTAAGEEKDTADKCINYFINFISQLTLHATFQVSQPGGDVQGSDASDSSSTGEKLKKEKRWGEERWRILKTIVSLLFKKAKKDSNDQITLSLACI